MEAAMTGQAERLAYGRSCSGQENRNVDLDRARAARGRVFLDLFGQVARLVIAGLVVGVLVAVGLRGVGSTLLFGVTAGDPLTYLMPAAVFSAVACAAVTIPARRASLLEPIKALRYVACTA